MDSAEGKVSLCNTPLAQGWPLMQEIGHGHLHLKREAKSCDEVGGSCCPLPLPLGTGGGRWTSEAPCRASS